MSGRHRDEREKIIYFPGLDGHNFSFYFRTLLGCCIAASPIIGMFSHINCAIRPLEFAHIDCKTKLKDANDLYVYIKWRERLFFE